MNEDITPMASNTASVGSSDECQIRTIPHSTTTENVDWYAWLREHGNKIFLFARQQTRSSADAEDVLQDALVKLAQKEANGTFDGGQAAWLPYIYTCIRRCAIDLGRKEDRRGRREEKSEIEKIIQYGAVEDPWFETESSDNEALSFLEQVLKSLPEKFSSVFTLKIWGELTFAEIGMKLDISQNTAASRYRYGLDHLKKHLSSLKVSGDIE